MGDDLKQDRAQQGQAQVCGDLSVAEVRILELVEQLGRAEASVDVLESNARVQARLLADTGRERDALRSALERCAGAIEPLLREAGIPQGMKFRFTGRWEHLGTVSIKSILDEADAALAVARHEQIPVSNQRTRRE